MSRSELQDSLSASSVAIHEFRIPSKALLGLHSYCPVLFDAFHAVLVDISIHISLLRSVVYSRRKQVPRFVTISHSYIFVDCYLSSLLIRVKFCSSSRKGDNFDARIPEKLKVCLLLYIYRFI